MTNKSIEAIQRLKKSLEEQILRQQELMPPASAEEILELMIVVHGLTVLILDEESN